MQGNNSEVASPLVYDVEVLLTLATAAVLLQAPDPAPLDRAAPIDKKTAYLQAKVDQRHGTSPRRGWGAHRPIWAHNLRTHDIVVLTGPGKAIGEDRDRFFKCWFSVEHTDIPDALVDRVIAAAEHFDVRGIKVISGFRHPKYNLSLVKKGREVARNSQHTEGNAIDFFLPGVPTKALYDYLLEVHPGGVGFYPVSEFVHADLGRKRTWRGT